MPKKIEVLPGERYGRLVIVKEVHVTYGIRYFLCKCDCGNEKVIRLNALRKGVTKSCGCYMRERNHDLMTKHGLSLSNGKTERLYGIWSCIKQRCNNPKNNRYHIYGKRGIKVCAEWENDFMVFREWALNNGYSDGLTIDRTDVNGNYEPSNCRWATNKEQSNNRRTNVLITYQGETHNVSEWADITGIAVWKIRYRHRVGLPLEQVFFDGNLRLRQTV